MRHGHTPFGYRIENGTALIHAEEAKQIRDIYTGYLSGLGYIDAAKQVGLSMSHASVKRMLQNRHYLGDAFYPAIIDQETFDAAEEERQRRCNLLGRNFEVKPEERRIPQHFSLGCPEQHLKDPYEQAAYIYSLIESEE